ncbi:MAG: TIR domain-containing protein [Pseudomonadota bacterium]
MLISDLPNPPPAIIEEAPKRQETGLAAFLTYPHEDQRYLAELVEILDSLGIAVSIDKHFMTFGDVGTQIVSALTTVDLQFVMCNDATEQSDWCKREICFARDRKIQQIPVFVQSREKLDWLHLQFAHLHGIHLDGFKHSEPAKLAIRQYLLQAIERGFVT